MISWIYGSGISYLVSKLLNNQMKVNIQVVHVLPGRLRLQCHRWKDEKVVVILEQQLAKHKLIKHVKASGITGSLLIEFVQDYLSEVQLEQILAEATSATVSGFVQKEADLLKQMKRIVNRADQVLKVKSLGKADLRTLIICYLIVKGVIAFRNNSDEAGRQLLWAYRFINGEGGR